MLLLDRSSNSEIDVANTDNPDELIPKIISGEVVSDRDSMYKIKLPGGQVSDVNGSELDSYLKQGASFYGKNDLLRDQEAEKFGSTAQQIAAAGLGGARGLSLGLSDLALTKTGLVSPEYLQKQEEFNPELGLAGEVAGAIAPAFFTGGTSTAANVLAKTPAGIANAIGKSAATTGTKLAGKIAPKSLSPLVQGAVTKATELGLGSAAESALFGAGKAVSESAIQDKPLTAEAVLMDGGYSALIGGLTGGVLGSGASLAGEAAKKASGKLSDILGDGSGKFKTALAIKDLAGTKSNAKNILNNDFKSENLTDVYEYLLGDAKALDGSIDIIEDFSRPGSKDIGVNSFGKSTEDLQASNLRLKEVTGEKISKNLKDSTLTVNQKEVEGVMSNAKKQIDFLDQTDKRKAQAFIDTYKSKYDKVVIDEIEKLSPNKKFGKLFKDISANEDEIFSLQERMSEIPQLLETNSLALQKRDDFLLADISKQLDEARAYQKETMNHALLLDTGKAGGKEADKVAMAKFGAANKNLEKVQANYEKLQKNLAEDYGPEFITGSEFMEVGEQITKLKDKNKTLYDLIGKEPEFFTEIKRIPRTEKRDFSLEQLWEDRKFLDGKIYRDGFKEPPNSPYVNFLRDTRKNIESMIEEKLAQQDPKMFKEYKEAKRIFSGASDVEKLLENKLGMQSNNYFSLTDTLSGGAGAIGGTLLGGPVGGLVGTAAGAVGRKAVREYGDRAALVIISKLEKRAGTLNKVVDESIEGLMSASRKVGVISSIAASGDKNKSYDEKMKELEFQKQRIDDMKNELNMNLGELGAAAPETALQLRDKTINAMDFLTSKMPKSPEVNPLVEYRVPESQVDKFNRYVVAVENPQTIMKNLKGGYISPEEVEVLKKVYPEIHLKLKSKALDLLSNKDKKKDINYQLRLQLQKLLDTKSDVNLYPTSVKTLQQSFQAPQANQQQSTPARLPGSRAKGLNLGSSQSTGLESTLRRRNS